MPFIDNFSNINIRYVACSFGFFFVHLENYYVGSWNKSKRVVVAVETRTEGYLSCCQITIHSFIFNSLHCFCCCCCCSCKELTVCVVLCAPIKMIVFHDRNTRYHKTILLSLFIFFAHCIFWWFSFSLYATGRSGRRHKLSYLDSAAQFTHSQLVLFEAGLFFSDIYNELWHLLHIFILFHFIRCCCFMINPIFIVVNA